MLPQNFTMKGLKCIYAPYLPKLQTIHRPYKVLNGLSLAQRMKEELAKEIKNCKKKPKLALIQVADRSDSTRYIRAKKKGAAEIGLEMEIFQYEDNEEQEVLKKISQLNDDERVNGIVVQLPLPQNWNRERILNEIAYEKDVDLFQDGCSATAKGVMALINEYDIEVRGKHSVVIGYSELAGQPISKMLLEKNSTVSICHVDTPKDLLKQLTQQADILICAAGVPHMITKDYISQDCVVIDVGVTRLSDGTVVGDVDFEDCKEKTKYISPVPYGVGPLTISSLLAETVRRHKSLKMLKS